MLRKKICALFSAALLTFSCVNVRADDEALKEYVLRDTVTAEYPPEAADILSSGKKISVSIEETETHTFRAVMNAEYSIDDYEQWTLVYVIKDENGDFRSYSYFSDWFSPDADKFTYSLDISPDSYSKLTNFTIEAFVIESMDNLKPLSRTAVKNVTLNDEHITSSENKYIKTFSDSYAPDNNITFSTEGNILSLNGKISDSNKIWIWSFLTKEKGNIEEKYAEAMSQKGKDNSYSSSADISGLEDGNYYLYLMSSTEQYSLYTSFITGSVAVYIKNGEGFFAIPKQIYENNINLRENEKNPPEYFINQKYPSDTTIWVHQDDEKIYKKAKEITKDCTSEYEMITAIHDWVCENVYYNYDYYYQNEGYASDNPVSDLDTLEGGYSVCHGYSNLFASLCRSLSIPCRIVTGYGLHSTGNWNGNLDGENHAWNEAYIEDLGRWVIIDCTWDSQNKKLNGEFIKGDVSRTYFDITDELFSCDHRADSYYNK